MKTQMKDGRFWLLLAGDWLILMGLVAAGQQQHEITGSAALPSFLATTLAIAVPWTVTALLFGLYRADGVWTWKQWLGRMTAAWLIAAPLGLMIRAVVLGRSIIPVAFMAVILGLGGLLLLTWRALARRWGLRRAAATKNVV